MARTDSWAGLSTSARVMTTDASARVRETHEGAFYNTFPLHAYVFADGRVWNEVVQTDIWAGGPTFFTTLEDALTGERVSGADWSDQELADQMGFQVGDAEPAITESEARFFADFAAAIDAGSMQLSWSDERKYARWKAALPA